MHIVKYFQVLLCITNNSIKHQSFVCTQVNDSTTLFLTIQFSINHFWHSVSMSNSSIWPIDRTLSGATTPGQGGPGSNGNDGVLCIPQSSSVTRASLSDYLMSYPRHSAEMQSVFSTAPDDLLKVALNNTWVLLRKKHIIQKKKKKKNYKFLFLYHFMNLISFCENVCRKIFLFWI